MFEVGFSELLLIMALALIVLGPEKLPKVASQVGRWMGRARSMARQFRETLEEEVQLEETRKPRSASGNTASGSARTADVATGAVAGGLAASEPPAEPVFDTSNIPYADVPQQASSAAAPDATPDGGFAPTDDPDTRHNDYPGAAYEPPVAVTPVAVKDAPVEALADADVQRGT